MQFLMKFILFWVTLDLSDNLTEMRQTGPSWKPRILPSLNLRQLSRLQVHSGQRLRQHQIFIAMQHRFRCDHWRIWRRGAPIPGPKFLHFHASHHNGWRQSNRWHIIQLQISHFQGKTRVGSSITTILKSFLKCHNCSKCYAKCHEANEQKLIACLMSSTFSPQKMVARIMFTIFDFSRA